MNRQYTNEISKTLNCKIYYKPEPQITSINLEDFYKIKNAYVNIEYKSKLIELFCKDIAPPLLVKLVVNYLYDNYTEPDTVILREIVSLILSAMPDLNEKKYTDNITNYVNNLE